MSASTWDRLTTPLAASDSPWELFHENSKGSREEPPMHEAIAATYLAQMPESLSYDGYPTVALPEAPALPAAGLHELLARPAATALEPAAIPLDAASSILRNAYGVVEADGGAERRRRTVHSAGSLYPLEIFAYSAHVDGLAAGLYHYNPARHALHFLLGGDQTQKLAPAIADGGIVQAAALMLFVAALPERSVLKYGDRGYRYTLLEAGAVVQNATLAAGAIGLAAVHVGDYFDRMIDDVFGFDGLTLSTMYIVAIGKAAEGLEDGSRRPSSQRK